MRDLLMPAVRAASFAGAILLSAAGCGGGTTDVPPAVVTPVLTTLNLSGPASSLLLKETAQMTAATLDQKAQAIAATVSWSSSAPTIASVASTGLVLAVAPGTATVTATAVAGGVTLTRTAVITAVEGVTSVTVTPSALALVVGGTGTLNAAVVADSRAANTVVWTTSSGPTATVSALGVVTAASVGTAQVCAISTFDSAKQGCATVTVAAPAVSVATVTVAPPSATLLIGQTQSFTAPTRDAAGNTLTGRPVAWTSSATAIATVAPSGLVSAVGAGTATITATSEGRTGTATVTVSTPTVTAVVVSPVSPSVSVGQSVQLSAAVSGTNNPPTSVSWASADVAKVTVNVNGVAVGVAASSGTQVCATSTFDTSKFGCATVTVVAPAFPSSASIAAPGFVFNPSQVDIALGGTVDFSFSAVTHNVTFNAAAGVPANIPNTSNAIVSRQFNTVGTFNFQCTLHAGMTGAVVVH